MTPVVAANLGCIALGIEIGGKLLYEPQDKQVKLHGTFARQVLYGGAAGGGKSTAIRWDLIARCLSNSGCQAYLFRRTRGELEQNHIVWVKRELADPSLGKYSESRNAFEFSNGSTLYFCYCEREADVTRYQGAEMHVVGIDEASHLTPFQISYLKTRNRLGSFKPTSDGLGSENSFHRMPRFIMGSNPGGPGHNYLKQIFIDTAPPGEYFHDKEMSSGPEDKGWLSVFIPAQMSDNAYLDDNYEASFGGLPPELARALKNGDWDAVVGQALHTLSRERHQLRSFNPPRHWTRFQVIDWGTASPFSIGWYCVAEDALLEEREGWPERWLPSGSVIRYAEWYGWNGKPNQGLRLPPQKVARGIIEKEHERKEVMDYRVADNEMWAMKSGPAAIHWFEDTHPSLVFKKSIKDRKRNYQECLARLAGNTRYMEDGSEEEDPMFFCTANCTHFWRTVPTLTLDEVDHEKGPGDKQSDENHCLHFSTQVYTTRGDCYIGELGAYPDFLKSGGYDSVKIWTRDGWKPFINLGRTGGKVDVWRIKLAGHREIQATPGHPFLCADGEYRRLDELTYTDYIACADLPEHRYWPKISSARLTGCADVTMRDVGSAFTGLCGSTITGLSRRASTFITRMTILRTIALIILSCFRHPLTSSTIQTSPPISNTPNGTWKPECDPRPSNGMGPKKERNGTLSAASSMQRFRHVSSLYARDAARKVWPNAKPGNSALMPAVKGNFAVAILDITPNFAKSDVYNIHVPGTNDFVIEAGAIVHNCYDEWAYAMRSQPFVTTQEDRYLQEWGEEERRARGKGVDPYATG